MSDAPVRVTALRRVYFCHAVQNKHPLTFDTYLHQSVPLAAAVAQEAEGAVAVGHHVTRSTRVQQLVAQLEARVSLQTSVGEGRRVAARHVCRRQTRE